MITGSDEKEVQRLIEQLDAKFSLKDLGEVNYFLGIEVKKTESGLFLSQSKYIKDLLCRAQMQNARSTRAPLTTGQKFLNYGSQPFEDPQQYRSIVGALQYLTITRPELAFSVNKVCQFMHEPLEDHWKAVKRILRYLSGTVNCGIHLSRQLSKDH